MKFSLPKYLHWPNRLSQTTHILKQHFYKQHQAEIGKKLSKS